MGEIKSTTIRLSEETIKSFREMAENQGLTQEQCLSNLLSVFEFHQAKDVLKDRKKEIEIFEEYIARIQNLYLTSLEMNLTGEEKIHKEFVEKMADKDNVILSLNKEVKDLKEKATNTTQQLKENADLLSKNESAIKSFDEILAQNKFLINKLSKENESLTAKITELTEFETKISELEESNKATLLELSVKNNKIIEKDLQINSLQDKITFLEGNLTQSKKEIDNLKEFNLEESRRVKEENSLDKLKALQDQKDNLEMFSQLKLSTEIRTLTLEKDTEINLLKNKISSLEEQLKNQEEKRG